jgi:acyl carrier protein
MSAGYAFMSLDLTIRTEIKRVASEQGKALAPLTDNLPLHDSGLDSLCYAILVTRLEDELGIDPFDAGNDMKYPTTLGEFVSFYERALPRALGDKVADGSPKAK